MREYIGTCNHFYLFLVPSLNLDFKQYDFFSTTCTFFLKSLSALCGCTWINSMGFTEASSICGNFAICSVHNGSYERLFPADLAAVVCYGFLIVALLLSWSNEANTYLLLFCLSNGLLAITAVFKAAADGEHCQWNGWLSMPRVITEIPRIYILTPVRINSAALFSLTLGYEALHRSQTERRRMALRQFRMYNKRPIYLVFIRSVIFSAGISFAGWHLYLTSPALDMLDRNASSQLKKSCR